MKASAAKAGSPRKGSFNCRVDAAAQPHTLILGTQPGDLSLEAPLSPVFQNPENFHSFQSCRIFEMDTF